jgi:hypothetical protein
LISTVCEAGKDEFVSQIAFVGDYDFATPSFRGLAFFYSQLIATDTVLESNCADNYSAEMSPNQVSEMMGIPLIELTWLPQEVGSSPKVAPYTLFHVDIEGEYTCVLRISYSTPQTRDVIDIRVFAPTSRSFYDAWSCHYYDERNEGSVCFGEVLISDRYSRISMFTSYPPEVATRIAHGIIIPNRE